MTRRQVLATLVAMLIAALSVLASSLTGEPTVVDGDSGALPAPVAADPDSDGATIDSSGDAP